MVERWIDMEDFGALARQPFTRNLPKVVAV
jgi:hypothetical protein